MAKRLVEQTNYNELKLLLEKGLNLKTLYNFGFKVRQNRKNFSYSQEQFAACLALNRGTVVNLEKADNIRDVSLDVLYRLNFELAEMGRQDLPEYKRLEINELQLECYNELISRRSLRLSEYENTKKIKISVQ